MGTQKKNLLTIGKVDAHKQTWNHKLWEQDVNDYLFILLLILAIVLCHLLPRVMFDIPYIQMTFGVGDDTANCLFSGTWLKNNRVYDPEMDRINRILAYINYGIAIAGTGLIVWALWTTRKKR